MMEFLFSSQELGSLGIIFAVEGLRAVAAVPSPSKIMPQLLPIRPNVHKVLTLGS